MRTTKLIKQLAGESAVYGLSGVVNHLVAVLLLPIYTRLFTRAEVGTLSLIDVTATLAMSVAVLGLDSAAARWFYDLDDETDRRKTIASWFWCQLVMNLLLCAAMIGFSRPLAHWLTGNAQLAPLVWLAALSMPLIGVLRVWSAWLRFQRRVWSLAALMTVQAFLRVGLILLCVLGLRYALAGVYLGRLGSLALLAPVGVIVLWPWLRPKHFDLRRLKQMLRFGLPLAPAALGVWVMTSSDRIILRLFYDQAEVGLYDMAAKLSMVVALGVMAFQQAWGPFAYSLLGEKGAERVYAKVLDVYSLVACSLATAVALFGPLLFRIMTTEPFYPAVSCLPTLAFVHAFAGARSIAGLGSGIAKRSVPIAAAFVFGAVINVGLNFALIPIWGRNGAAAATLAAYGVTTAYLFIVSRLHHPIPYRPAVMIGSLATSVVLILAANAWVAELSLVGLATRAAMLLAFVPLGYWLGGIRWEHLMPENSKSDSTD